jgi:hypothetical protein
VPEGVAVGVRLGETVSVPETEGEAPWDRLGVRVRVPVAVRLNVPLLVSEGVLLRVPDSVPLLLDVTVSVPLLLGVNDGVVVTV